MSDSHIISFPGLGIGQYEIFPTAFTVFGLEIKWYGIIITCGIILAFLYVLWRAKFERIKSDHIYDLAIFVIIFSVIGARLYYVIFNHTQFHSLREVINIRSGGLAIYGGIIAGAITTCVVSYVKKLDVRKIFDMLGPAVMLGQIIGRWGNFMNAEAYGRETTLPWGMCIQTPYQSITVHPTFLYESLWNLVGFIGINLFYKKKKYNGQIALLYVTWYGLGRMWIEGLRTDSLYLGNIRISQLVAGLTFVAGAVLLIVCGILAKKNTPPASVRELNGEVLDIPAGQSPEFPPAADPVTHQTKDGMTALTDPGEDHQTAADPEAESGDSTGDDPTKG